MVPLTVLFEHRKGSNLFLWYLLVIVFTVTYCQRICLSVEFLVCLLTAGEGSYWELSACEFCRLRVSFKYRDDEHLLLNLILSLEDKGLVWLMCLQLLKSKRRGEEWNCSLADKDLRSLFIMECSVLIFKCYLFVLSDVEVKFTAIVTRNWESHKEIRWSSEYWTWNSHATKKSMVCHVNGDKVHVFDAAEPQIRLPGCGRSELLTSAFLLT